MEVINYLRRVNGSGHIVEHVGWHESGDYMLRLLFETGNGFRQHKYEVENEYSVIDKSEVDALERGECGHGNPIHYNVRKNGDRCCSFCGSLHPNDVIAKIKKHGIRVIGMTDKGYKWYVGINSGVTIPDYQDGGFKYYRNHDTPEFIKELNELIDKSKLPAA